LPNSTITPRCSSKLHETTRTHVVINVLVAVSIHDGTPCDQSSALKPYEHTLLHILLRAVLVLDDGAMHVYATAFETCYVYYMLALNGTLRSYCRFKLPLHCKLQLMLMNMRSSTNQYSSADTITS
jgi:hypothetical protein